MERHVAERDVFKRQVVVDMQSIVLFIGLFGFAEYSLFYRALLKKRPVILRS